MAKTKQIAREHIGAKAPIKIVKRFLESMASTGLMKEQISLASAGLVKDRIASPAKKLLRNTASSNLIRESMNLEK